MQEGNVTSMAGSDSARHSVSSLVDRIGGADGIAPVNNMCSALDGVTTSRAAPSESDFGGAHRLANCELSP